MNFVSYIIDLCNENNGFISAILTVMSIVLSIKLARLPYLKKVSFNSYLDKNSHGDIVLVIFIANIGNCPIYVDEIITKEGYRKTICSDTFNSFRVIIKPQEYREHRVVLRGYKPLRTNEYKPLRIVMKAGRKTFKYRIDWAMGWR